MPPATIPDVRFTDLYDQDPVLPVLLRRWMGEAAYDALQVRFHEMGRIAASCGPLSARADKEPPRLHTHDARGDRVDRVVYHPDYLELKRLSYGKGIIGIKYDEGFLREHRSVRHLVGFTLGYLFGQTEMGLFCPICMTDGVGRVLERHARGDPVAEETLRHLGATDLDDLWEGAMFLTEKQGGSDVGANAVQATETPDGWVLDGDKWFCSNVDAKAILALARMPGQDAQTGTRGLGLFLVLRERPDDNGRTIRIHRLKDKLGVRSMATGEVTFEGTRAHLIGGAGEGFKQMAEMLNLSRLYNSVASIAAMRRGVVEAVAYGREQHAFGQRLVALPLWRATMADVVAEQLGALLLVFETIRNLDAADGGDDEAGLRVRLLTPLCKAVTGKLSVAIVSESMEAIGGNAYIEEHVLARMLRDAQVLPIWEGTTSVLALDAMRVLAKEPAAAALAARVHRALDVYDRLRGDVHHDPGLADGVRGDLDRLVALTQRAANADAGDAQRAMRGWTEAAARVLTKALLLETAAEVPGLREVLMSAARRLHARASSTAMFGGAYSAILDATEGPLLHGALSPAAT